ncbi:MAG: hypothetical protein IKT07_08425 [Oscillospiraceae bacterium]|nr:hypothetical protein [Oscillospiraceae bacterium]
MIRKKLSFLLILLLFLSFSAPFAAAETGKTIHIGSEDDLRQLVAACALDSYSIGIEVSLDVDLDLSGSDVGPIPVFNGTFRGNGHTVSGLHLAGGSNQGLFRYVQADGLIRDLHVAGTVLPAAESDHIGGVVGTNFGTIDSCTFTGSVAGRNNVGGVVGENYGTVMSCSADATVSGKRFTGGVVGYNAGLILSCGNYGAVNTEVSEEQLSLDDLSAVSSALYALDLLNAEDENVISDSGGVVGYSGGIVLNCDNHGSVGYQHYGYNVGGIAGRQAGYLNNCRNYGNVLGKKDVAGVVGQMEPYINLVNSENLADEITQLNEYMNAASGDLQEMSDEMNALRDEAEGYNVDIGGGSITGGGTISGEGEDPGSGGGSIIGGGGSIDGGSGEGEGGAVNSLWDAYTILSDSSSALSVDLTNANNQFSKVMTMFADAMGGDATHEVFEDVSEDLPPEETEGRVSNNLNYGRVEGDNNVGGVIGAMGVEYEFDMEDTIAETVGANGIVNNRYETKCVSSGNINQGVVAAKKDRVGGVVGSAETGTVVSCENYGSVSSTEGGYAGGVAGYSSTSVRQSYAMCTVGGSEYVGGIVGYGAKITDCASMIDVSSVNICTGAIAGWADVNAEEAVDRNIYVHSSLGAIDGISYAGKAAPVSYQELIARSDIPDEFRTITVTFLADGIIVKEIRVPYGGDLAAEDIPEVPEKFDHTGSWAPFTADDLRFNVTVEAEYSLNQNTLAVDRTRGDSPMAILLVDGEFTERIVLSLNEHEGPLPGGTVLEAWDLTLDGYTNPDGQGYTIRYLAPASAKGKQAEIWQLDETGKWSRIETGTSGSYLTFHNDTDQFIFAAVEKDMRVEVFKWAVIGVFALVLIIVLLVARSGLKKKNAVTPKENHRPATDTSEKE